MRFVVVAFMVSVAVSLLSERLGAAGAENLTGRELVESSALARASTARLSAETCDGFARGSAFAVDGATITSHHLVDGAVSVRLDDGRASVERPVLAGVEELDAARLAETGLPTLRFAAEPAQVGDPVVVAGHPAGGPLQIRTGTVHLVTETPAYGFDVPILLLDVATSVGFSGGPVLDVDGGVVGMLAATDEVTGLAIAIPTTALDGWLTAESDTVPNSCRGQDTDE